MAAPNFRPVVFLNLADEVAASLRVRAATTLQCDQEGKEPAEAGAGHIVVWCIFFIGPKLQSERGVNAGSVETPNGTKYFKVREASVG